MTDDTTSRGTAFVAAFDRYYPGPLVMSLLLVVAIAVGTAHLLSPFEQLEIVATGFYDLLVVQAALIFWWVLAATLVYSERVGQAFDLFADGVADSLTLSSTRVIVVTALTALLLGWINWALGLIGGVFIGQKLARIAGERDVPVHYPAVLFAGLLGLVIANQGPTSPGGLLMADSLLGTGNVADIYPGGTGGADTEADQITTVEDYAGFFRFFGIEDPVNYWGFLLHPANLAASVALVVTLPVVLAKLAPQRDVVTIEDAGDLIVSGEIRSALTEYSPPPREEWTFADKVENSRILAYLTGVFGLVYVVWFLYSGYMPSMVWFLFSLIVVGLLVHDVPQAYIEQCTTASQWAVAIGLPFVFYAAAVVMVDTAGISGPLGDTLAGAPLTELPSYILAFGTGLVVPDPGSVWLIAGPIIQSATGDLMGSLVLTMYASGISNLWLAFVFLGIFANRIDGFDWREFAYYALACTIWSSAVVILSVIVF